MATLDYCSLKASEHISKTMLDGSTTRNTGLIVTMHCDLFSDQCAEGFQDTCLWSFDFKHLVNECQRIKPAVWHTIAVANGNMYQSQCRLSIVQCLRSLRQQNSSDTLNDK